MDIQKTSRDEVVLADWLQKGCAGDARAYQNFLQSVSLIVRGIIRAKAGGLPQSEQEDILQEVLLAIHDKRATWRQTHPVKPWFYAIARYKIVDAFRKRGKHETVDIDDFSDILGVDEPEYLQERDIESLVAQLPSKQQKVVRMIGIEGKSNADVAKELNMNPTAVRVNFHRALEKLKSLSQGGDE